ncbi:MAG: cytochrome c biogenesis protein ResB [Chloroflexi bacterium]|nr:cytochrome c biogenesis protein ResB [Chloroflexota bacterium]
MSKLWRFLCSTRLALILILLMALATLIGTLVIQAPSEIASSAQSYASWAQGLGNKYKLFFLNFTGVFDTLGFYRIYSSWYFRGLGVLLGLNILACTVNTLPGRWRQSLARPRVKMEESFFLAGSNRSHIATASSTTEDAATKVRRLLSRRGYRTLVEADQGRVHIYADRFRFSPLGTIITHSGLIILLLAVVLGGLYAQRNILAIADGAVRPVGMGTNLTILNEGFVEEDYPSGVPKDYRSDIVLYDNGVEVKRGTIRVNSPLEYNELRFHQSYFGNATLISVKDTDGNVLFQDSVELTYQSKFWGPNRPTGYFNLPGTVIWVELASTARNIGGIDPLIHTSEVGMALYREDQQIFLGKLAMNQPQEISGLEFTYLREKQFTGITVARNPGVNYVWLASGLIVAGAALVFYLPHRRLWALAYREGDTTVVRLAGAAPRTAHFGPEFEKLAEEAGKELGAARTNPPASESEREA